MHTLPSLAIVVPCYNEEEVLEVTHKALETLLVSLIEKQKISEQSRLYYVDDGSKDNTWQILESLCARSLYTKAIKLAANKGHQNALYAGLVKTTEDMVVSIDADLQDDHCVIEQMVDDYLNGNHIVYGVRGSRQKDSAFKRITAEKYYSFMRFLGVDLVFNHADFRLMSRPAMEAFKAYPETNLFLRGIVREIGFKSSIVEYERAERMAGESKYPLRKMLSFAWEGITSFSTVPLRSITVLGFVSGWVSILTLVWVLGIRVFTDNAVPGWASILLPLLFIGSVQLLCLGIIGEYIAKIYSEVKRRPHFHIEKMLEPGHASAHPSEGESSIEK